MTRKNLQPALLQCDLCPFTTKNNFIYKRHRIRCRREDAIHRRAVMHGDVSAASAAEGVGLNEDDNNTMESSSSVDSTPTPLPPLAESAVTEEPVMAEESGSGSEGEDAGDDDDGEPSNEKVKPKVRRNYTCAKCGMQTRKSKKFLYHLVEVHKSSTDIFACRVCEYCSRYRHKIQRHMKFAHKLVVAYGDIDPEHAGVGRRKLTIASKVAKPVKMKSFAGRKLTVKFTKPHSSGVTSTSSAGLPAPVEQGQKRLNIATATTTQSLEQLSRVVEQVVLEEGRTIYKCKECQFMNEDKLKVARHAVSWHVDTKSFTCSHCDYISFDRNDFLAHRITHRNEHQFRCDECTYSTDFRPNYDRHLNNHRSTFPFKCSFCSYGCGSDAAIRRHMASNHDPVPPPQKKLKLPVPKCVSAAAHTAVLDETDDTSSHTSPVKSPIDTLSQSNQSQITSSEINQSEDPLEDLEESAEDLLLQFNKSSLFDTNSASMVPRPVIPLPEGIEMDERELSPHRKLPASILRFVKKDDGKLVCPACKLKYKRSSDLNRHMKRKHGCRLREFLEQDASLNLGPGMNLSGISDIEDDDAGNLEDDEDLNDDYVVGNVGSGPDSAGDDEPLVSAEQLQCQFCEFRAKWPSDLKRHTAVHSIEKRYECNLCSKKYKYLGDMNVHIRKDHKVEPERMKILRVPTVAKKNSSPALFKCAGCEYTSTWKSEVDRHSQMHTGEKKFQCANCDYQTYWRGDIRRHIYRHHPGVMAEGVAIDDVITVRKDKSPLTPTKLQNTEMAEGEMSGDWSSDYNTPVSTPDKSREGTPDGSSAAAVVPHSPSPSPIKEIGGGQFECQYCGFVASAPSKMNSHIATHTNLKRYMCPVCGRRANWKWDIAKHLRTDHPDQVDVKVVKLSRKEAERTIHAYIEENPTVKRDHHLNMIPNKAKLSSEAFQQYFKCSQCDFSAENRISVARHIRYMHKGEETNILMVRKQISKKKQTHIQTGNQETATVTPENNKALNSLKFPSNANSTPTKLVAAVGSAQQDASRPFMCSECGKRGATKGDVKKHYHYLHPDREIRIIYLGDGSQSVYAPKADNIRSSTASPSLATQQPHMVPTTPQASPGVATPQASPGVATPQASPSIVAAPASPLVVYAGTIPPPRPAAPSPSRSPSQSPAKSGDSGGPKHPKNLGYIKPFKCGLCGRRSNWRWDVSKHIRERHPGMNVEVITLSEAEARATVQSYVANELPVLNKSSNSVPRRSPEKSPAVVAPPKAIAPATAKPILNTADTPPSAAASPAKVTFGAGVPSKGVFRQFMCSACPYRSNWRADITRHIARRHTMVTHARLIMLDKETAAATLDTYDYKRGTKRKNVVSRQANQGIMVKVSNGNKESTEMTTPLLAGPLPKKAWAGLEKKLWKCSLCPYTNSEKVDCLHHLAKHNMKAYKCTVCNWTSNFRSGVYRHIQIKHAGDQMAFCRLSIKLIKEGPGLDESGQSIVPAEAMPSGSVTYPTSSEKVNEEAAAPVKHTFAVPGKVPMEMALTVMFHCKLCLFKSKWRSCVCRHVRKLHNSKDFRSLCVKKIVRGTAQVPSHAVHTAQRSVTESPSNGNVVERIKTRNFACTICPYRTYKAKMLKFHMTCHTPQPGVKQAKCKYCPYYVNGGRLLAQHTNLHLVEYRDKPSDKVTGYPLTPVKSKNKMVARSPQSPAVLKRHRCEKCPYTTNSKNDYLYHKQFHRPKPTADFKCDYCDYWVAHRRLIKQHMKVHEEDPGNCSSNFSEAPTPTKSEYSDASIVYDAVDFAAAKQRIIASKITPSISQSPLVSPMKIASSCSMGGKRGFLRKDGSYRKIHRCRHCPYMNIRLRNLKLHELMHGKRSASHPLMKCPHCDYFVGSKGLLGHHLKVHQPNYDIDMLGYDESKLENGASEDCEMDVTISMESKVDSLLEIARFKKYGCEKCPYGTSKRAHFQRHLELHGSKQKCKCDFCDYSVPTMNLLNQHSRLHFEPNQNLLAAQSILNLQRLPEMPADVALASMMANNDSKHPISVTHDHVDLYENAPEDLLPKKLYRCDRCPYANVRRDHLLAHLRCHMIKNEYACPYCDYSVMKIHVLMQHVKVHFSPLPEFCDWLSENGDPARMREVKDKDMREAIDVVRLFQREKEKEAKTGDGTELKKKAVNMDKDSATVASGSGVNEKETDVKMETEDGTNAPESEKGEVKQEEEGTQMEVDEDMKDEELEKVDAVRNGGDAAAMEANVSKMDGTEAEQCNGSSVATGQAADGVNGQTDSYVCQYCDRDFPTSDCLVRHEMQHLIGNNYKLIQQADQDPDVIVVEDDSQDDTCQSNPPSQIRLDPDGSDRSSGATQQSSDSTGAAKPGSIEHGDAEKDGTDDEKSVVDISTTDDESGGNGRETGNNSEDKQVVDKIGELNQVSNEADANDEDVENVNEDEPGKVLDNEKKKVIGELVEDNEMAEKDVKEIKNSVEKCKEEINISEEVVEHKETDTVSEGGHTSNKTDTHIESHVNKTENKSTSREKRVTEKLVSTDDSKEVDKDNEVNVTGQDANEGNTDSGKGEEAVVMEVDTGTGDIAATKDLENKTKDAVITESDKDSANQVLNEQTASGNGEPVMEDVNTATPAEEIQMETD